MILQRFLAVGKASRALILVPESLTHQWFVELLRRFNLWFHIYDAARCDASGDRNPFLEAQFVLCSMSLLTSDEKRSQEALDAGLPAGTDHGPRAVEMGERTASVDVGDESIDVLASMPALQSSAHSLAE